MRPDRIPLFPLNVVLLPGGALPLHIFEPRYHEMVKDCLEAKSEFGVLLSLPKGLSKVGCTAEIVELLQRHPDGRLDILVVGRAPFRVLELFTENPLCESRVDYLDDDLPADLPMNQELIDLYETCHTLLFGDYPKNLERSASQALSYLIASTLPMDLLWKQVILERRSERDRQHRLVEYLRQWAPHLQKAETLRTRAANGHGLN